MFKGLSEQDDVKFGKKPFQSKCKLSSVEIGNKQWSEGQWVSNTKKDFITYKPDPNPPMSDCRRSQVEIGGKSLGLPPAKQYETYAMKNSEKIWSGVAARPHKTNQELLKTQYNLGTDKQDYLTINQKLHNTKHDKEVPYSDINFKKDRVRYDIIRNQDLDQKKLKDTAIPYEFYNDASYKGRITQNVSYIPQQVPQVGSRFDPITGRQLKF